MSDPEPFDSLVPDAQAFLRELAANNTRDWFQANKARYDDMLKAPALLLLDRVAADWGAEIGQPLNPKLFRANRDVRFSKDKTPYNTHLHMLWAEDGGPGWFFGIGTEYVTAGAGMMAFDKDQLTAWRAAVDGPRGVELADTLVRIPARIDEPELKRVPAPFDKDHPNGALLRRKSLALWIDISNEAGAMGLLPALYDAFGTVRPAVDLLRRMV